MTLLAILLVYKATTAFFANTPAAIACVVVVVIIVVCGVCQYIFARNSHEVATTVAAVDALHLYVCV